MLKLHLEFKKTARVDSIMHTMSTEMESLVKKVGRILLAQKATQVTTSTHEEFAYLLKQHQRVFLAGLTFIWILQKEERRVFDNQSNQTSQLFDHLSQCAHLMKEILMTSTEVLGQKATPSLFD